MIYKEFFLLNELAYDERIIFLENLKEISLIA